MRVLHTDSDERREPAGQFPWRKGILIVPAIALCLISLTIATDNPIGRNEILRSLQEICYDKGHKQAELNEYQIRRMQFFEQYYDARIILWMVVFITISGVILAGLQLAASYRLSLLGRGVLADSSEMTVEHSRVVLKSSAMGVFILVISFGQLYL
jgi:hypothetical protein